MSVIVQKFGGTSVANPEKIRRAAARAVEARRNGHDVVMVVSARGQKTDELVELANAITQNPRPREMDMLLATGEQESVALMAMAVHELGEQATSLTGAQIGVLTDESHTRARIVSISTDRMRELLGAGHILIAAGFQGVDSRMNITTLGRGGSDTTATALAAVLEAEICEIYTDVEGVFTTDPRMVSSSRKVERISYDEMLELASLGAGVMHSRSIEFAKKYSVPLRVRPSYSDASGTLIAHESAVCPAMVSGVAAVRGEALITVSGVADQPGVMSELFASLATAKIPVDMVVQNVARAGVANISFTVAESDLSEALAAVRQAAGKLNAEKVVSRTGLSKVSIVGEGMKSHSGVASRLFQILAEHGISVEVVTTSEIRVSVLIGQEQCEKAVNVIHDGFDLHQEPVAVTDAAVGAASFGSSELTPEMVAEIVAGLDSMESILVSDVSVDLSQARLTLTGIPDAPGVAAKIFGALAAQDILVDLIVQNLPLQGLANVSCTIPRENLAAARSLLPELRQALAGTDAAGGLGSSDDNICKLTISGIGLRSHADVGRRVFRTLAEQSVNVLMVCTSEVKISIAIAESDADRAADALRSEFGLTE